MYRFEYDKECLKDKRTNNDLLNTTQKTIDRARRTGLKCPGRVDSSCSTSDTLIRYTMLLSVKCDKGLVGDRGETNIYVVSSPIKVLSVIEERQTST